MAYQDGFPVFGMRPPANRRGVPNPLAVHVHPYPTRYHGGIWTRPVTAPLPYMTSVQSVFKPDNFVEGNPAMMRMGVDGLGAVGFEVQRGIFGVQRQGGGIFSSLQGLGDYLASTSPPALKSPDDRVKELQQYLNRALALAGLAPVGVDGKLGAQTCGAIAWYKAGGRASASATDRTQIDDNLSYMGALYGQACASKQPWKAPAKASTSSVSGGRAPLPPPTSTAATGPVAPLPYSPPMSTGTKAMIGMGIGALVVGGGYWALRKKGLLK